MSSIVFLIAFVVLSLLGGLLLWLRDRGPRSMEAHMRAFERELEALSPETPIDLAPRRRPPSQSVRPRQHPTRPRQQPPHPRQQPRARPRGPGTG